MKPFFLIFLFSAITCMCFAQERFWKFESEQASSGLKQNAPQMIVPQHYRTVSLSFNQYKAYLNTAPAESLSDHLKAGIIISLPYPDNSFKKFRVAESPIMEAALAAQFPQIKTYVGQGIDDPASTVHIDYTPQGFHAFVLSPAGSLFIDPYQKANSNLYITYFSRDYVNPLKGNFICALDDASSRNAGSSMVNSTFAGICTGAELRTYRLAISCTGEYAIAVCPAGNVTVANTLSAIVTTLNRVNGVYRTELALKMVLVGGNASVIYTNPGTDPYSGNDQAATLIDEGQSNITSVLGAAAFDIGHTFSTGTGGLASIASACNTSSKAMGVTGLTNPTGDAYDIDYVAHEIGHQFGATHAFESEIDNCGGGNRFQNAAYEPGSGTTIMAYAGICGSDNIQLNSDPYFHTKSFDQITEYTTTGDGNTCAVITKTGNTPPVVVMPVSSLKIPKATPFTLSGTATDVNGDAISYSWEQWDLSNSNTGSAWDSGAFSTTRPLFKARIPKTSGSRTFPDMAVILANYPAQPDSTMGGLKGETLPQVARDIKFRLVARDNNVNGGGVATGGSGCSSTAPFKVVVTNDGPFKIILPNTAVNWLGGSTQTVRWDVANTNNATAINVQNVDILMSTDGGNTFPITILSNTPNDGAQSITVPNIATNSKVRIMVKATGNIFFDVSNENFSITFISELPDSLLKFSASPNGNNILLQWLSDTLFSIIGFDILRSEGNDSNFVQIGFLPATGGGNAIQNYTFNDTAVKAGVVYFYRLKQIGFNNAFFYSAIKRATIVLSGTLSARVQPQPFYSNTGLYLDGLDTKDFLIVTIDVTGRVIIKKDVKNSETSRRIPLDFNKYASGIYFIKIVQGSIEIVVRAVNR